MKGLGRGARGGPGCQVPGSGLEAVPIIPIINEYCMVLWFYGSTVLPFFRSSDLLLRIAACNLWGLQPEQAPSPPKTFQK
jgi:hypothetical protein